MSSQAPLIRKIDHLGIAVADREAALRLFHDCLGLPVGGEEEVAQDRVRTTFISAGEVNLELLEATDAESPVAKFLAKRGGGVHHLTFLVDDLQAALEHCRSRGVRLIDETPRRGAHNAWVAFLHPKDTAGVLVELKQGEAAAAEIGTPATRRIAWDRLAARPAGLVRRQTSALAVIDVQEKMLPALEPQQRFLMMKNLRLLLRSAPVLTLPVLATEQYPKGLGRTAAELQGLLAGYPCVEKVSFSACGVEAFQTHLAATRATQIVLTGVETHVCVLQTGLGLLHAGFEVHVAADAVCSRTSRNHEAGLALLARQGAVITTSEAVLFALLEQAGTDEFKAISPLLK